MNGISLNGTRIPGLGLGQDPAAAAAGAAADAAGKAALTAPRTWGQWWQQLGTPAKVGVVAAPVAVIGTGVYLVTRKKQTPAERRRKRSRR